MLVDEVRVFVAAGRGGNGGVSFHREKYRPKGGPDGGNGGRGGSVVLLADRGTSTLSWLADHPHQRARPGAAGQGNHRTGADAEDLVIAVPPGTVVRSEGVEVLADLAGPGDRVVVARGGRGGRGNAAFASDWRRAPGFAELGEPGEERWIGLELRLAADAAVIGFPNAGKSTLVGAVSGARPKVADYAFTTREPSLGVVAWGDDRFTICDVPGVIEGAHEGKGLGIKFLRHAMRALVLVHLVDLSSGHDALADYRAVRAELEAFDAALASLPEVVALSKADLAGDEASAASATRFREAGTDPVVVSALTGLGLGDLLDQVQGLVLQARAIRPAAEGFELFRTEPDRLAVSREGPCWRVRGRAVERMVAMTDVANPEGVAHLQFRLERAGVERALAEAGAVPGDEVRIGDVTFEWWPTPTERQGFGGVAGRPAAPGSRRQSQRPPENEGGFGGVAGRPAAPGSRRQNQRPPENEGRR